MTQNNLNVLTWHDAIRKQHVNKSYAYGQLFTVHVPLNQLPPFQVLRPKTGAAITVFKLVKRSDGTEIDILDEITQAGLRVSSESTYDLIIYPATVFIMTSLDMGTYHAVMSDGANTWYSEHFTMVTDISEYIKIEWCHGEDFSYNGGHVDYGNGYKNYMYVRTELGRPTYPVEEQVINRDGHNFSLQTVTYKLFRFEMKASEYLLDAMRVISQHDFVTITYKTDTYSVDEFTLGDPDWQEWGDVAILSPEFKTDTVIVINGRGVETASCDIAPGGCFSIDYTAKAILQETTGKALPLFYYVNGVATQVQTGDYFIINNAGTVTLRQYNGTTYANVTLSGGEIIYIEREAIYYSTTALGVPFEPLIDDVSIAGGGQHTVTWYSIADSFNEFYWVYENGDEVYFTTRIGTLSNDPFNVTIPSDVIAIKLKVGSIKCGMVQEMQYGLDGLTPVDSGGNWMTDGSGNYPIS